MTPLVINWSNTETAIFLTKILLCISTIVPAAEYLAIGSAFKPQGLLSGKIMALHSADDGFFGKRISSMVFSYPVFFIINMGRVALSVGLLFTPPTISFYFLLLLTALSVAFYYRTPLGNDGSDQMNLVLCVTMTILYSQPQNVSIAKLSLGFIAAQSLLAYFVAGVAKLVSPVWRSGEAVKGIMNTRTYGDFRISQYLNYGYGNKAASLALCWSVIVMETLFPLVLLLPGPYFWIFIFWGVAFHLYNAVVMGLNVFFCAFLATYPSILFLRAIL